MSKALLKLLAADTALTEVLSPAEFGMLVELLGKVARAQRR